ncbi:30S ribosome-binding factor RbfA [Thermosulfurimonas marina]|uniref:30S ribosome-binding factor RbfA n=1 Tax=Thermosulfurimonas marina TaxID=2047767 RepID=UPI00144AE8EF|nr:30S ribosome-binding factor RbfA [Thermosulfurimonas marina]
MHYRHLRVAELIREALAVILSEEVRDPDLQGFITVSEVEVSPDLRRARVYYRVHGEAEDWARAERGFRRARGYIRSLLAEHVYLKYIPELEFHPDHRPEETERLEELFERLKQGKDSGNL